VRNGGLPVGVADAQKKVHFSASQRQPMPATSGRKFVSPACTANMPMSSFRKIEVKENGNGWRKLPKTTM
jgi:hypothetical protein